MSEQVFTVVFVDDFLPRATKYRIRGSPSRIRICSSMEELENFFSKEKANLVFISCTFNWRRLEDIYKPLIRHFYNLKFDGVIVNSPIRSWAEQMVNALKRAGIPARWYPYDWRTPSMHQHFLVRAN